MRRRSGASRAQGPRALLEPPLRDKIIARTHARAAARHAGAPRISTPTSRESREPLCGPYLVYVVCVPPPPSSGVSLLQMLAILDRTDIATRGPGGSAGLVPVRDGEPADVRGPGQVHRRPGIRPGAGARGCSTPGYIARRAALIGAIAGPGSCCRRSRADPTRRRCDASKPAGTSHFVVVDRDGQRRLDDDHGRIAVRLRPRGRRIHAEQPAHGFLVSPGRRRRAGRECRRGRQAAALLDGAGDRARRERAGRSRRSARRAAPRSSPTTRRRSSACSPGSCRCSRRSTCRT